MKVSEVKMANQFRGIPFENDGENLCYCNSGSNALLSSEKLTSQIKQDHCLTCEACAFLYRVHHPVYLLSLKLALQTKHSKQTKQKN